MKTGLSVTVRRPRLTPREPVPAAKPVGALVAATGILLLVTACASTELPGYWQPNMPALWGMAAGALIAGGLLLCYLRFTLRFFLLTTIIVGSSGALAQLTGLFSSRVTLTYPCPPEAMMRIFEEGLVGTLQQEQVISSFPAPLVIQPTYANWEIHFRPHVDTRVAGLSVPVQDLCEAIYYPNTVDQELNRVVDGYVEAVRERFGTAAALHVAQRSAELAPTPRLQDCFRSCASILDPPKRFSR